MTKKKKQEDSIVKGFKIGAGILIVFILFFLIFDINLDFKIQPDNSQINIKEKIELPNNYQKEELIETEEKEEITFTSNEFFKQPLIENLDCNNGKNYNISQSKLTIETLYYGAYPSLNEYKFWGIFGFMKNNGCTRLKISDFYAVYSIYQDGILLAEDNAEILSSSDIEFRGDEFLYPDSFVGPQFRFGDRFSPVSTNSNNPDNYTFEIYLIYSPNNEIVYQDKINFDMNGSGEILQNVE